MTDYWGRVGRNTDRQARTDRWTMMDGSGCDEWRRQPKDIIDGSEKECVVGGWLGGGRGDWIDDKGGILIVINWIIRFNYHWLALILSGRQWKKSTCGRNEYLVIYCSNWPELTTYLDKDMFMVCLMASVLNLAEPPFHNNNTFNLILGSPINLLNRITKNVIV